MRIHYLFSDKRVVRAAIITFNGVVQQHVTLVDDKTNMIIRRTFKDGMIAGSETLYGAVVIELPHGVKGGPYKTPDKVWPDAGESK